MARLSEASGVPSSPVRSSGGGRWPLMPLAPLIVSLVALGAATLIALVAVKTLQSASDEAAEVRTRTLSAALAVRLAAAPPDERRELLAQASTKTNATYLVFGTQGNVVLDAEGAPIDAAVLAGLAVRGTGLTELGGRRLAFSVRSLSPPLETWSLLALVEASAPAEGTGRLTNAVLVLTLLLLAVAIGVALVLTGATRDDLRFIRQRLAELARSSSDVSGPSLRGSFVPLRSFDQVGALTAAVNGLVARFSEAERSYRSDLEAAAAVDVERSEFLAGLSHELRTPLNAILGFSHLLESESDGPLSPDAHESLAMIRTSGEHLKALIDDILDLSAAETGQLRLSRAIVDVRALAEAVVREARATTGARPVELVVDGAGPAFAWADGRRVRQVLTNLVTNALKATAEGEVRVHVAADPANSEVCVVVSDTGRGIAQAALRAIFEPYRQAGEASTRLGGVGLGLAITRQLVLLHGGTIAAVSQVGRGSVFTVRLPDDQSAELLPQDSLVPWADEPTGPEPARGVLPSLNNEITERRRRKDPR